MFRLYLNSQRCKCFGICNVSSLNHISSSPNHPLSASRLLAIRRLRLVIVLPLDDPMYLLNLSNIQIRHMKSILLLNPILDLLIRSLSFSACSINLIQIYLYLDMIIRFLLGQKNNSLIIIYYV